MIIIYFILLCLLILITPPYGDPAVVLWTSKIMSKTGFPYDPVCSKNISDNVSGVDLRLCVRSPLYYLLLALSSEYYKIVLIILVGLYFILQVRLARNSGLHSSVYGLMFPPIYLLFSRTYVDGLTVILSTTLLLSLIKLEAEDDKHYQTLLFLTPLLLMLTRESSIVLPFLLFTIILVTRNFKYKNLLMLVLGWIAGLSIYHLYINLSGGVSYSDFQPHIPSLEEVYRAIMRVLTPIIPWEVTLEDLQEYLPLSASAYGHYLLPILVVVIHLSAVMVLIPMVFSLIHFRTLPSVIIGWLIFSFLVSAGLLFLKGDIDFFRHLSYLIPVASLLIEKGLTEIGKYSKFGVRFIKISFVLLFSLYLIRTVRLYTSGYTFDPCQYISKRPEISSIPIFYETACR